MSKPRKRKPPKETKLGSLLRRRREAKGRSLTSVARAVGVDPSTLRRIENGEIADLRVAMLVALADQLEFGLDDLVVEAGLLDRDRPVLPEGLGADDLRGVEAATEALTRAVAELGARARERSRLEGGG